MRQDKEALWIYEQALVTTRLFVGDLDRSLIPALASYSPPLPSPSSPLARAAFSNKAASADGAAQ